MAERLTRARHLSVFSGFDPAPHYIDGVEHLEHCEMDTLESDMNRVQAPGIRVENRNSHPGMPENSRTLTPFSISCSGDEPAHQVRVLYSGTQFCP